MDCCLLRAGSGLGCHIGHMFVGILAYADDLILLAPTPHTMHSMLQCCEEHSKEYDVLFRPTVDKSKCIISSPREVAHGANVVHDISFLSYDQRVTVVIRYFRKH